MRYYFIINPLSKGGKSRKKFDRLFEILNSKGVSYDYKIFASIKEARVLSMQKARENYDIIVAVGGDGTINAVINGMYNEEGCLIGKAAFGVVYTGTSPDFCKSYGVPIKLADAVRCLLEDNRRTIPIPQIRFSKVNNPSYAGIGSVPPNDLLTSYYACCANIGIGAALARKANGGIRNVLGDKLGTLWALIGILRKRQHCNLRLAFDGQSEKNSKLLNLSVGRTKHVASGIKYHCALQAYERKLYAVYVRDINLWRLPVMFYLAYSGHRFKNKTFMYFRYVNEMEVSYNDVFPEVEMDGDPVGYLPCKIKLAKDELTIISNLIK